MTSTRFSLHAVFFCSLVALASLSGCKQEAGDTCLEDDDCEGNLVCCMPTMFRTEGEFLRGSCLPEGETCAATDLGTGEMEDFGAEDFGAGMDFGADDQGIATDASSDDGGAVDASTVDASTDDASTDDASTLDLGPVTGEDASVADMAAEDL